MFVTSSTLKVSVYLDLVTTEASVAGFVMGGLPEADAQVVGRRSLLVFYVVQDVERAPLSRRDAVVVGLHCRRKGQRGRG